MAQRHDDERPGRTATTGFSRNDRASRIARLIVLDMVLWPGLLLGAATLVLAWQARGNLLAIVALAAATFLSVAVGKLQWRVMLDAAFPRRGRPVSRSASDEEASPRLTGRGGTNGEC